MAPRRLPPVIAPVGNSDQAISVFTSVGFMDLSAVKYAEYIRKLSPDIAVSMPDVAFTPILSAKRIAKMADRTQRWLKIILESKESIEGRTPILFAPILPIPYVDQADYIEFVADEAIGPRGIEGLAFYDIDLISDMPATTTMNNLPRLSLDSPSSPHEILRQISLGIDIVTIPLVNFATDAGLAFTFACSVDSVSGDERVKPLALDLFDTALARNTGPLMLGCTCYTCASHHCAFVQHLLAAKEMLGWVLLQIHNHEIMSSFFSSIRAAIRAGTFSKMKEDFERQYESSLPLGTGETPRARGYHFRAEGPGEPKRNKAAWGHLGVEVNGDSIPTEEAE